MAGPRGVKLEVGVRVSEGVTVLAIVFVLVGVYMGVSSWIEIALANDAGLVEEGFEDDLFADWQAVEAVAVPILPPPETVRTILPKSPVDLIVVDWLEDSWKGLAEMVSPSNTRVQLPRLVISLPTFLMTNLPFALGSQVAVRVKTGFGN